MKEIEGIQAMVVSLKSLGIDKLSIDDRVILFHELQQSIEQETAHPSTLTEARKRELDARIADMDANPNDEIPWEVIKNEAIARLRKK